MVVEPCSCTVAEVRTRELAMQKRAWVVGVAVVMAFFSASCKPVQLDIDFTLRRSAKVSQPDASGHRQMALSGILACSGGTASDAEPLDLFVTAKQNGTTISVEDGTENCQHDPKIWTQSFDAVVPAGVDLARPVTVTVVACTNPSELIDEDCTRVTEAVTFILLG